MKISRLRQFKVLGSLSCPKMLNYEPTSPIPEGAIRNRGVTVTDCENHAYRSADCVKSNRKPEKLALQSVQTITGIAVAYNCVSWAQISVSNRALSNWKSYPLPDFQKPIDETVILNIAHEVAPIISHSDFYVIEVARRKWMVNVNEFCLRCMLMALITSQGGKNCKNIFALDEKFVNNKYNLLVGKERISPKEIIKKEIQVCPGEPGTEGNKEWSTYSGIQVTPENLEILTSSTESQQGGLSLAVLIALTFTDSFLK